MFIKHQRCFLRLWGTIIFVLQSRTSARMTSYCQIASHPIFGAVEHYNHCWLKKENMVLNFYSDCYYQIGEWPLNPIY